jgi:hypothetical protein
MRATHTLSDSFRHDLMEGRLSPVLEAVKADDTLHLGIRDGYVTIYYRGGQLIALTGSSNYGVTFDRNYDRDGVLAHMLNKSIDSFADAEAVVGHFGVLKGLMDRHPKLKSGAEREFQQLVARINNRSRSARSTHYFITDIEHAAGDARFDMLGAKWHHSERRKGDCLVPVIFEMKYGEGQLTGGASLEVHLRDALAYIDSPNGHATLRANVEAQFEALQGLGLFKYEVSKTIERFSTVADKVQVVFLLAEYPPHSRQLHQLLGTLEEIKAERDATRPSGSPQVDLLFAAASLCGYALFEETMLTAADLRVRLAALNSSIPRETVGEMA